MIEAQAIIRHSTIKATGAQEGIMPVLVASPLWGWYCPDWELTTAPKVCTISGPIRRGWASEMRNSMAAECPDGMVILA